MLFNSYLFVFVFLPAVLAGFYVLRWQRARLAFVVAASYVFYGYAGHWFPVLMIATTAISFVGARAIEASQERRRQVVALIVAIAGVLSILLYFKYAGFGAYYFSKFVTTITGTGLPSLEQFTRGIVLPIGISFYTFESISYLVDVYRGDLEAERDPLRYAFFISFFPHLIAGPIVRYGQLRPQLERFHRLDWDLFRSGLLLFSLGLTKKILLADGIAFRINTLLRAPSETGFGFTDSWMVMFAYAFQIYFDFSAYTDMALGLARMLGIELPWNFNRPYRAVSPRDFWRRWHVTLSTWLRDYLYIPLGGNRKGPVRRDGNLLATMGLGGLWHGAQLNFVEWGLFHGGLLVGDHHVRRLRLAVPRVVTMAVTFVLVTIGWVLFRLHDRADIKEMYQAMTGMNGSGHVVHTLIPLLVVCALVMWGLPEEHTWKLERFGALKVALVGILTALAIVAMNDTQQFLYFKF
jgi:alginate O-acetyltransferase complex protein AlgI